MISLSVIIVAFNNLTDVADCIASIIQYNDIGRELELIVIDNGSDDSINKYLHNSHPEIIYRKNENKGFGEANNVGARLARGSFLLFLNGDTVLKQSLFKFALDRFNQESNLGIFGVQLISTNGKPLFSFGFIDKHGFTHSLFLKFCQRYKIFLPNIMFISGANMFIKRAAFFESGCFDQNIFLYYEEQDLIKRLKLLGYKVRFFPEKSIVHKEGSTISNESLSSLKYRLSSYAYYCKKYNLDFNKYARNLLKELRFKQLFNLLFCRKKQFEKGYLLEVEETISSLKFIYEMNKDEKKS